jgi:hypothetical protein
MAALWVLHGISGQVRLEALAKKKRAAHNVSEFMMHGSEE